MVANVHSKWENGELVFYNESDGAEIMRIKDGSDGVTFSKDVNAAKMVLTSDLEIAAQYVKGQKFVVNVPLIGNGTSGTDVAIFIPPAPCKVMGAYESHSVTGSAVLLSVWKNTSKSLNTSFAADATFNTPRWVTGNTDGTETLAAGDKVIVQKSGAVGVYEGVVSVVLEWL